MGLIMVFFCFLTVILVIVIDLRASKQLEKIKKAWIKISSDKDAVEEEIIEKPKFKFEDIKKFGAGFWLNTMSCVLQKNASMGYIMWIPIQFYKRYDFKHQEAAFLTCIPYMIMIILAPFMGIIVDRYGKNMLITTIGCSFLVLAHLTLILKFGTHHAEGDGLHPDNSAIIPICLLGISLTIFNIVSNASNISLLVEEKAFGTAIGINYSIQNIGLTLQPILTSELIDDFHEGEGWRKSEIIFLSMSIGALASNLGLWFYDWKYNNSLLQNKDHNGMNVDQAQ
jgi:MFS family permease